MLVNSYELLLIGITLVDAAGHLICRYMLGLLLKHELTMISLAHVHGVIGRDLICKVVLLQHLWSRRLMKRAEVVFRS